MGATEPKSEFLLRAEIRSAKETLVSHARELTSRSVFVVTDWLPPLGTDVRIGISFPSVFGPIEVRARVFEQRPSRGIGSPAGIGLAFDFESNTAREAIARIVERVSAPTTPPPGTREYRVLLVEDNSFIRDMFAYGIGKYFAQQRTGHVQFDHAGDAATAWQMIERAPYDLAIVDYYLPAEDGAALIARLRRDARFAGAPVVAISVGGHDAREATMSAGADLFLEKPIVLRDLFRTLQVLSQRGALA